MSDYYDEARIYGVGSAHWASDNGNGERKPLGFSPPKPKVELPSPRRVRKRPRRK